MCYGLSRRLHARRWLSRVSWKRQHSAGPMSDAGRRRLNFRRTIADPLHADGNTSIITTKISFATCLSGSGSPSSLPHFANSLTSPTASIHIIRSTTTLASDLTSFCITNWRTRLTYSPSSRRDRHPRSSALLGQDSPTIRPPSSFPSSTITNIIHFSTTQSRWLNRSSHFARSLLAARFPPPRTRTSRVQGFHSRTDSTGCARSTNVDGRARRVRWRRRRESRSEEEHAARGVQAEDGRRSRRGFAAEGAQTGRIESDGE